MMIGVIIIIVAVPIGMAIEMFSLVDWYASCGILPFVIIWTMMMMIIIRIRIRTMRNIRIIVTSIRNNKESLSLMIVVGGGGSSSG